ncbi:ComEC/Rec2 family competence protein [Azospirillum griseum]|uniref:Metallo-beta-lactamase domain-containing protein n=1 Tax=Azospirillum griseum TaxID=2496639 RepID=A0A3S0HXM1_9PROT|nr:hypothetical protein [Azospirillum griseum]RTR16283.1 hypothetical protein EJ903_21085 [Azospirillum griseum]
MPWSLEICHIGLLGTGDATLIVATFQDGDEEVLKRSSVLIDGGRSEATGMVEEVLAVYGINDDAPLGAVAVTHYDADHFNGVRDLIRPPQKRRRTDMYRDVRVYDRGRTQNVTVPAQGTTSRSASIIANFRNPATKNESIIHPYSYMIKDNCERNLVTRDVLSSVNQLRITTNARFPFDDPRVTNAGIRPPYWLIGQEILWNGENLADFHPDHAPRLTCVSANTYYRTVNGGVDVVRSGGLSRERNENINSLGFLLTFGNFRYFVGGDMESAQEDALLPYFRSLRNGNGPLLHAMKASHHGSNLSSSPNFLKTVKPNVVIFSCGQNNQFPHPEERVISSLHQYTPETKYYNTGENWRIDSEFGIPNISGVYPRNKDGSLIIDHQVNYHSHVKIFIEQPDNDTPPQEFSVNFYCPEAGPNLNHDANHDYVPARLRADYFTI